MERDPATVLPDRADPEIDPATHGHDASDPGDRDDADDDDDDVLVLSWWQNPINVVALVLAAALLAGMTGWLLGSTSAEHDAGDVDTGFLQDMRVHHEQAVAMGFMYLDRPDTEPGLRTVARQIVFGQALEIGRMVQLLRDFDAPEAAEGDEAMAWMDMRTTHDAMPGMASTEQLEQLARADGADADELFVDLMTAHHEGGIHMAEFAAERAGSGEVRRMAEAMAHGQRGEIAELRGLTG